MKDDASQQRAFAAAKDAGEQAEVAFPGIAPAAEAEAPAKPRGPLTTQDMQAVLNVPVRVRAVLGRARMDLGSLLRLGNGEVIELDRRAGEPVDIYINDRFAARGEVVLIDNVLGVTLTEIARQDR